MEKPDIVVGTPSRVLGHLVARNLTLRDSLEMVVIDEADLVFSFGYETDVKALLTYVACVKAEITATFVQQCTNDYMHHFTI